MKWYILAVLFILGALAWVYLRFKPRNRIHQEPG